MTFLGFLGFKDIDAIKRANDELGHFFFSDGAMRFFNSRIHRNIYAGRFFITSERYDSKTPRQYKTAREARRAIKMFIVHGGPSS